MYINIGNLLEAKAWLEGERWEEKVIKSRTITLTEEDEDDEYFGFILEDTNKFYVMDCEEIYLIE